MGSNVICECGGETYMARLRKGVQPTLLQPQTKANL